MAYAATSGPWWREPTKDNWYAFIAAWLGWTLDAFDFTVFLFLLAPIAKEFHANLTLVVLVGSLTMWMRFVGAIAAGWMADRMGRRAPLIISILWYSACNFQARGFRPEASRSKPKRSRRLASGVHRFQVPMPPIARYLTSR